MSPELPSGSAPGPRSEAAAGAVRTIVAVSDLHLGVGTSGDRNDPRESFRHDATFAEFLDSLESSPGAPPVQLLLLGDIFELPGGVIEGRVRRRRLGVSIKQLITRMNRIADAHSVFFSALARFLNRGGEIAVVPGNHDPGLMVPPVFETFGQSIERAGTSEPIGSRLVLHPWMFRIDGALHAEHGNQYHDLNAYVDPLQPCSISSDGMRVSIEDPLGSALHRSGLRSSGVAARFVSAGDLALSALTNSAPRRRYRATTEIEGLDNSTLTGIGRLATSRPWAAVRRVVRRSAGSRSSANQDGSQGDYLTEGAVRLHDYLSECGLDTPIYLFGHSHRAACFSLGATGAVYANAGSWASASWGGPDANSSDGLAPIEPAPVELPYVEVTIGPGHAAATLRHWPESRRQAG